MALLRIESVEPLEGFRVRLRLTAGSQIERELAPLLVGPIFAPVRSDSALFRQVQVEEGTLTWPNGADLCPDVVIWGGPPPTEEPLLA